MRIICTLVAAVVVFVAATTSYSADKEESKVTNPLELKMTGLDGKEVDLSQFKGKVVLFVNVASQCGYTPQYDGLQKLYDTYRKDGLVVVGVPANEFGQQEPGTNDEIAQFCKKNYGVTFPMLAKVVVKGQGICPLYQFLTSKESDPKFGGAIGWNFEKFLINRKGEVVGRFKSDVAPDSDQLTSAVKAELAK